MHDLYCYVHGACGTSLSMHGGYQVECHSVVESIKFTVQEYM